MMIVTVRRTATEIMAWIYGREEYTPPGAEWEDGTAPIALRDTLGELVAARFGLENPWDPVDSVGDVRTWLSARALGDVNFGFWLPDDPEDFRVQGRVLLDQELPCRDNPKGTTERHQPGGRCPGVRINRCEEVSHACS